MEVKQLISALEETIALLRTSEPSAWSSMSTEDLIRRLEGELAKATTDKPVDILFLECAFAPTSAMQELSIDNGWGTKFLKISEVIDRYIGGVD